MRFTALYTPRGANVSDSENFALHLSLAEPPPHNERSAARALANAEALAEVLNCAHAIERHAAHASPTLPIPSALSHRLSDAMRAYDETSIKPAEAANIGWVAKGAPPPAVTSPGEARGIPVTETAAPPEQAIPRLKLGEVTRIEGTADVNPSPAAGNGAPIESAHYGTAAVEVPADARERACPYHAEPDSSANGYVISDATRRFALVWGLRDEHRRRAYLICQLLNGWHQSQPFAVVPAEVSYRTGDGDGRELHKLDAWALTGPGRDGTELRFGEDGREFLQGKCDVLNAAHPAPAEVK